MPIRHKYDRPVNVERALRTTDTLDGHVVLGHVQCVGDLVNMVRRKDGVDMWFSVNGSHHGLEYKQSVAINGVSLTIAEVFKLDENTTIFRVAFIPHTLSHTTFGHWVNMFEHDAQALPPFNLEFGLVECLAEPVVYDDAHFMRRALELAERGRYTTAPNPWVGCVLVDPVTQSVLGEGFHVKVCHPHAEINAFADADVRGNAIAGCTLYVTLEPCHCVGRTPPCDAEIVNRGVKRVVVGILDPDDRMEGLGMQTLRDAGIQVEVGVCRDEITSSLRAYIHHRRTGRPYCVLKIALSLDGAIEDSQRNSRWITGEAARRHAHRLRAQCQAVAVGAETARHDKPQLTVRHGIDVPRQPLRVVFDTHLKVPTVGPLFDDDDANNTTWVFCSHAAAGLAHRDGRTNLHAVPCEAVTQRVDLTAALDELGRAGVLQCLVEGGQTLHASFLRQNLAQELYVYRSSKVLGKNARRWAHAFSSRNADESPDMTLLDVTALDAHDVLEHYRLDPPQPRSAICDESGANNGNVTFDAVETAILAFSKGGMVLVMDDESRENEGDLIVSAALCTTGQMTTMIDHTSGIICAAMSTEQAAALELPAMIAHDANTDIHGTAFTVTCDAMDTTTGVSAHDRVTTMRALAADSPNSSQLRRPGHVFPLVARTGGLIKRRGHTEAAVTLCQLAHIDPPVAAIGELCNRGQGTMMRRGDCRRFADAHEIPMISVSQLAAIVGQQNDEDAQVMTLSQSDDDDVDLLASCTLQLCVDGRATEWTFQTWRSTQDQQPHRVLLYGKVVEAGTLPMRIHSECFTGDVLGSLLCDCGQQLRETLAYIVERGVGILILPANQEGRGIGLTEKVKAYALQRSENLDTYEANRALGYNDDHREYGDMVAILQRLQVPKGRIQLLTSNPHKVAALGEWVHSSKPLNVGENKWNARYLSDKRAHFGAAATPATKTILNGTHLGLPDAAKVAKLKLKVAIVSSRWHASLVNAMVAGTRQQLASLGVSSQHITYCNVPGVFELPWAVNRLSATSDADVIVCFGLLIRGDTAHFDHVATATTQQLAALATCSADAKPIVDCVLTCHTMDQALQRTQGDMARELCQSYAITAVQMAILNRNMK